MPLTPLRLRPDLRRRPWGGRRLPPLWLGDDARREDGAGPYGEAWLAGPASCVAAGREAGTTLARLAAEHGASLIGTAAHGRYGARFPLLIKLLDAAEPLSIQVHPDDGYALAHEAESGFLGKTEAWWVLEAGPGAAVWWGFDRPVGRDEVASAAAEGRVSRLMRVLPVAAGDVVVNPAGTVHALGAGVVVFEVQQASDLTYRLDDHGRRGPNGQPRELHVAKALAVADLAPGEAPAPTPFATGRGRVELARTHAFVLERVDAAAGAAAWTVGPASCELLTRLGGGGGRLAWGGGAVEVADYETWLLPAGLGEVGLTGDGTCSRVWVPAGEGGA